MRRDTMRFSWSPEDILEVCKFAFAVTADGYEWFRKRR